MLCQPLFETANSLSFTLEMTRGGLALLRGILSIFIAVAGLYILSYLFARVFLAVECFISLAYLPEIVLQQQQWAYYFPHIG